MSLILFTWLAESAWVYLMACLLPSAAGAGSAFTPEAVLFPYGMAAATTLLLQGRISPAGAGSRRHTPGKPSSSPGGKGEELSTQHSAPSTRQALAVTALHLLAGTLSLLLVVWWELYRAEPLLDASWVQMAVDGVQRSLDGTLRSLAWLMVLGLFLWWRGTHLIQEEGDFSTLISRFLGSAAVVLGVATLGGELLDSTPAGWWLAGYLLFSLGALSMARLEATRRERRGSVDAGWQWRGPAIALLLLAAGLAATLLLLPSMMEAASWLRDLLLNLILPAIMEFLRWLIHLLGLDKPPLPLPAEPGPGVSSAGNVQGTPTLPDWLRTAARRLFDLSWITLILYAFYLWTKRWRLGHRRGASGSVTRERLPWEWRLAPKALLLWLLTRWPWLRRRIGWTAVREEQAGTIREIYRKLLRWGAERGHPRTSWTTPREYCTTLSTLWPGLEVDFQIITEEYLQARYGGLPIGDEDLESATVGWHRIAQQRAHEAKGRV